MNHTPKNNKIKLFLPVTAHNAGIFISRGKGTHPTRTIDTHELIFVRSGKLHMFEEQREFILESGESLLLSPGVTHGGLSDYPKDLSFYWMHFSTPDKAVSTKQGKTNRICLPQTGRANNPDNMNELFRLFLVQQDKGWASPQARDMHGSLLLANITASSGSPSAEEVNPAAQKARDIINIKFHEPISTSEIARQILLNPDYLGRIFRESFGHTLSDELAMVRIRHARELLINSGETIERIGFECGFENSSYFRRLFRKMEGMSPSAFRRLYAKIHINTT